MAVEFKDYYKILGVDRKADDKTIKSAYRKLARKHHPDVAKGKDSGERFKEITEAYEVLSDPEKRRRYDTLGPDWQRYAQPGPGGQPGGRAESSTATLGDFSEFFRTIFGDRGARAGRGGRAAAGSTSRICSAGSRGGGRAAAGPGRPGQRRRSRSTRRTAGPARRSSSRSRSRARPATAPATSSGKPCATCHGGGWQRGAPRGRREDPGRRADGPAGARVRARARAARGDLYLAVTVAPHRDFERRGDDIHLDGADHRARGGAGRHARGPDAARQGLDEGPARRRRADGRSGCRATACRSSRAAATATSW